MKLRSFSSGFTIVELLTVVAVAGALAAVAVPSYFEFSMNNTMATSTNNLVHSFVLARSEAGKRNLPTSVLANTTGDATNEWGDGWTVFVDEDADGVLDVGEDVVSRIEALPPNVTLDSVDNVTVVQYRPAGNLAVSPTTRSFRFCDTRTGETGREVSVSTVGRVTSDDFSCS